MKRTSRRMRRNGYTLLEVLIALALGMVLLGAVYASLSLYWKYSVAGQDEAREALLARQILRAIEIDLRSVVYHAGSSSSTSSSSTSGSSTNSSSTSSGKSTATTGSTTGSSSGSTPSSGSSSTSSSSSTDPNATQTSPDDALTQSSSGLFGNTNTLLVHVSKPSRTEMYGSMATGQAGGGRMSDLQSVAYFVNGQGAGALQGAVSSPGLCRMAGDRLLMQMADQVGNTAAMAANTRLLAPEVASISFYYYDGTTWQVTWDSGTLGALPKAVEIVLELIPANNKKQATPQIGSAENHVYRLIVAIPASKPVISTL